MFKAAQNQVFHEAILIKLPSLSLLGPSPSNNERVRGHMPPDNAHKRANRDPCLSEC